MKVSPSLFSSLLVLVSLLLANTSAFAPYPSTKSPATTTRTSQLSARRRNRSSEEADNKEPRTEIPQLPPTGSTSFDERDVATHRQSNTAFVGRKFELQYTCKVCDTRNVHKVSRIAYNKGVVICVCKGCMSQHLISDHLGFTNLQFDGNLEDYFDDKKGEQVHRVSEDVFHLEKTLGVDTKSGSIFGEDGTPQLE